MSRVGPSKLMTPTLSLKAFFQVDNAMTTQSLQRSCEPVLVLCQVIVSGPITALAASSRLHIWEANIRPLRLTQGRSTRT